MKKTFALFFVFLFGALMILALATKAQTNPKTELKYDTSRIVILPSQWKSWEFDASYASATLSQEDLSTIDKLLPVCADQYNRKQYSQEAYRIIDLKKRVYNRQYVAVSNKKEQKIVWVNCFCSVYGNHWKNMLIKACDGGSSFFNVKINLVTKKYYDLRVNGF